ncbi:glutamate binding protein [Cantharellus anzutake]|uniref:glutamate binding protein n=1 Tax=Cantharellus anzutake TaxID=1750568 RepID=UPI0019069334|nr:glutamate binding protein [Cantharellus anzutake]KAF8326537.1 glutamate binding protein [Cantharellus anzutake]
MSNYPKYGAANETTEPLLDPALASSSNPNAYYAQGGGVADFDYGVSVWDSSPEIKNAFIQKVYSILFVQILGTCIVAGALSQSRGTIEWVQANPWAFYVPLFATLINLGFLWYKRHSHPTNYILLGTFTLLESFAIGVAISFFDTVIVLQALLITLGVFLGLTLFTIQSKYDFSGMGPFLFAGLLVMIFSGLVSLFLPFNQTADLIYSICGALLFSGYVVYDTYVITKRLSPDEYIMGAISLYLDFINLFLYILRVLNNVNRD